MTLIYWTFNDVARLIYLHFEKSKWSGEEMTREKHMSFIMNVDRVGKSGNTHNVRVFFYHSNQCCLEWWVSIYVGHLEKIAIFSKILFLVMIYIIMYEREKSTNEKRDTYKWIFTSPNISKGQEMITLKYFDLD